MAVVCILEAAFPHFVSGSFLLLLSGSLTPFPRSDPIPPLLLPGLDLWASRNPGVAKVVRTIFPVPHTLLELCYSPMKRHRRKSPPLEPGEVDYLLDGLGYSSAVQVTQYKVTLGDVQVQIVQVNTIHLTSLLRYTPLGT